jgi:hypothetical protein
MNRLARTLAIGIAGLMFLPAGASALNMQFVLQGARMSKQQRANISQAAMNINNNYLRSAWGTQQLTFMPACTTAPRCGRYTGQIRIFFTTAGAIRNICGEGAVACHGVIPDVRHPGQVVPAIAAMWDGEWTSLDITHEVEETMVDPYANRIIYPPGAPGPMYVEICDPVQDQYALLPGSPAKVSDFVLPSYYANSPKGPWDAIHVLTGGAPLITSGGYNPYAKHIGGAHLASSSRFIREIPQYPHH